VNALHKNSAKMILSFDNSAGKTFCFQFQSRSHPGSAAADYNHIVF
jgi:hypothetical protein